MELLNDLVNLGPDGISIYRRRVGVYFSLQQAAPWRDDDPNALMGQIAVALPEGSYFDVLLDHRFSILKLEGLAQGPQSSKVIQTAEVLTLSGRDTASMTTFGLSIGVETIYEAIEHFAPFDQWIKRLILRMPSKDFRTFVYLDWDLLRVDPSRIDLAVKVETCIFVPRLASEIYVERAGAVEAELIAPSPEVSLALSLPVLATEEPAVEPSVELKELEPAVLAHQPLSGDMENVTQIDVPVLLPKPGVQGRTMTMIIPLSDDLRTSFLGFGYSVGAATGQARVLEIGAFRHNLRSSYSRLMGGTDVVDLKAQPPTADVVLDLVNVLNGALAQQNGVTCFVGSEVLSAEVLEIFRIFAEDSDLAIHAVICSAAAPSDEMMNFICAGLATPGLHVQKICFVQAGELSGFFDATGRARGYFGVPPVEGQSMARCMEIRSNVDDPKFVLPMSMPSRETHALERFIGAFRPLRDDVEQKPAA